MDVISQTGNLTLNEIFLRILVAAVISVVIYLSYWFTHSGTTYSKKFNTSLMTLTILTATVMTVIGNNIALSLGMAGALSIVRFRTAVKDSRDTIYIFWAVIIGLCAGVGDFATALIGSGIVFVVLLIIGIRKFYKVYKQTLDKIYLILVVIYAIWLFPVSYFLFTLLSRFIDSFFYRL